MATTFCTAAASATPERSVSVEAAWKTFIRFHLTNCTLHWSANTGASRGDEDVSVAELPARADHTNCLSLRSLSLYLTHGTRPLSRLTNPHYVCMPTRGHGAPPTDQRLKAGKKARSLYGRTLFDSSRHLTARPCASRPAPRRMAHATMFRTWRCWRWPPCAQSRWSPARWSQSWASRRP